MRVLVVGSGGREHALALKLSETAKVFCLPGNPGIAGVGTVRPGSATDEKRLLEVCREDSIDLVVFGPERPLIAGMADALRFEGIKVYGPSAACARIEGSKAFAKEMMDRCAVPTAAHREFDDFELAREYIEQEYAHGRQVVVKASGEALGKGVVVPESKSDAIAAARRMLLERAFGDAGDLIVVEQLLLGREVSLIAVCSGTNYLVLPSAQDYKAAFDGGAGPNTGGMGAISPPQWLDERLFVNWGELFIQPILDEFSAMGTPYVGTLYAGLMVTPAGPRALEYNARFGDPETQAVLARLHGDFAGLLMAAAEGRELPEISISPKATATVVIAARGYPESHLKEIPLPEVSRAKNVIIYHSGTIEKDGRIVSAGGRVLSVTALGEDVPEAVELVYESIDSRFDDRWHYRRDIGRQEADGIETGRGIN